MSTDNLDSADLKAVAHGGWIAEDVLDQVWDISGVPLTITDLMGSPNGSENSYHEWNIDKLADPDLNNAKVDGDDTINDQNVKLGARVGNRHQISTKTVKVSTRADASKTFGASRELARQVRRRLRELKRDVEAITCHNQASVADDGDGTAGRVGSLPAWLTSNVSFGAGGSAGGFAAGTVSAFTPGTARPGSEKDVKDMVEKCFEAGGDPTVMTSVPGLIRKWNEYLFTETARIATLGAEVSGDGGSDSRLVAKGSVNVYVADHGQVLRIIPNRVQQPYAAGVSYMGIYDPEYMRHSHLHGYRVEPLAKTGLAEKRQMAVDWTIEVLNEEAHAAVFDIDFTQDWVSGL